MPIYTVHLQGSNLLVDMHGRVKRAGFFTSRTFDVASAAVAEQAARRAIAEDPALRSMLRNEPGDDPRIEVEKIVEATGAEAARGEPGYAWFAEEDGDLG